jgi:hypothetical protein
MNVTLFKPKNSFVRSEKNSWTTQEMADFYRALDILKQAGLDTEGDSGVTDEGDPWFVFIRPESGDVIAHFAQINDEFVAVSSINQEVYKGINIRNIVDEMLERHPMLLPQSKNGAKLLLHPTAALSAFLAAAFILTMDGVKAGSIRDIFLGVEPNSVTGINGGTVPLMVNAKPEQLKSVFSELNPSNYNVAILGVALIAHELSQTEFNLNKHMKSDDVLVGISAEENNEMVEPNEHIIVGSNYRRDFQENAASGSSNDVDLSTESESEEKILKKEALSNVTKIDKFAEESNVFEPAISNIQSLTAEYEVFLGHSDLLLKTNYQSNDANDRSSGTDKSQEINQISFEPEISQNKVEVPVLLESIHDALEKIPSIFGAEVIDSLGVSEATRGELKLVSLKLIDDNDASQQDLFPALKGVTASISPIDLENIENAGYISPTAAGSEMDDVSLELPIYTLPILGHSLVGSDDKLLLSNALDAIDVVFYEGGNAEISNFELGTDLLWFFLSTDELLTAKNSINDSGDLIVDFGDIGTLTFLSMVTGIYSDHIFYA